nr:MAG TPA: Protein of unknown function (DUF2709) [Caudoviricetes sp.]
MLAITSQSKYRIEESFIFFIQIKLKRDWSWMPPKSSKSKT